MKVKIDKARGFGVVKLDGHIGYDEVSELSEKIEELMANPAITKIVLDMEKTRMLDSSGLGVLVFSQKKAGKKKELVMYKANGTGLEIIMNARLDTIFRLVKDFDEV